MRRGTLPAGLLTLALLGTACGAGDTGPSPSPTPTAGPDGTATGTPGGVAAQTCRTEVDGYAVDYPGDWHVNDPDEDAPCRWFHPEPFDLPEAQDEVGIAIHLSFAPDGFENLRERTDDGPEEILDEQERTVAGGPALRLETRITEEALLPEGTRTTQWMVDFGARTMVATTTEAARAGEYGENVEVLDGMMRSLRRVDAHSGEQACSAADLPDVPEPQEGLPEPVAETRREIYEAASACDFERLAELVPDGFTYTFGGGDDPIGHWRGLEEAEAPRPPMLHLAGLLRRPFATREVQSTTHYVWPSAFAYSTWEEVPEEDRAALKPLYDEEDFADFARFGGYVGYRVGIDEDGRWLYFVAGD